MAIYKNITTDDSTATILISSGSNKGVVNVINIVNQSATLSTLITIFLRDVITGGNPTYDIIKTLIPPQANLLLDNKQVLSFNGKQYEMKLTTVTAGGDANIDIIIK